MIRWFSSTEETCMEITYFRDLKNFLANWFAVHHIPSVWSSKLKASVTFGHFCKCFTDVCRAWSLAVSHIVTNKNLHVLGMVWYLNHTCICVLLFNLLWDHPVICVFGSKGSFWVKTSIQSREEFTAVNCGLSKQWLQSDSGLSN